MSIGRLLVANRGEIALRIIRACRELGIETVAVCSSVDTRAPHARAADEAVTIGPPHPRDSYLSIDAVLDAARTTGADAVHPGYGFLSESPDMAAACEDAGLIWVGPTADVISRLGSKIEARRMMQEAGVPVVPGDTPSDQSDDGLVDAARRVGYPLLVKASAAGNGSYNAAAPITREVKIKKPSKSAFFDERRYDDKYDTMRNKFAARMLKRMGNKLDDFDGDGDSDIEDAKFLFDSDHVDSDGDGVSNLLERAFGGDSLTNDRRTALPRAINKKDGKQRLSFLKYMNAYNDEGIDYIIERSTDLRTWTRWTPATDGATSGITQLDINGGASGKGKELGGGMERVVFETHQTATAAGGKQFLRVRIGTMIENDNKF